VSEWLQSKNVPAYIIEVCQKEELTGKFLLDLSKEDMVTVGIHALKERMELGNLIRELKASMGNFDGVGFGNVQVAGPGVVVVMEEGKGAPTIDAPPSYSD
jgi:hypothetical protein